LGLKFGLLAGGVVLLSAAPVQAASGADLLAPRFDLMIWSIVVFVLLFLVLRRFAWAPILGGLQKREKDIESSIEEARHARAEMVQQQATFERKLAEAHQQIPLLIEEARRDAEKLREEMRSRAAGEINAERDRLRREIQMARDQALSEIWTQTANLATLISAKAIRRSVTADDHRRLVDDAIAELKGAGKQLQQETVGQRR